MKKVFLCSIICPNGILGGGLYVEDNGITYKTNKLTVDRKYRNLVLPINEICELSWKWIIFPIATLRMTSGEEHKFIMFNKKRFDDCFSEIKNS